MGARIKGIKIFAKMIDRKGKSVEVSPEDLFGKVVAFPDEDGPIVKAVKDGEMINVKKSDVDYTIPKAQNMFSLVTNLIPFLQTNSGGRAIFGAAQITQAVPLRDREVPLVQAATDKSKTVSFDQIIGEETALQSHLTGEVIGVTKKAIKVKGHGGGLKRISLFDHLPLNQDSFIHSEVLVKKGDQIVKGQVVADTNNTKNGVLAMGKNLLIAVMPWKGYNYEDGIVISEKASEKLTSEHLRESKAPVNKNTIISMDRFATYAGSGRFKMTRENEEKIDKMTGLIRKGVTVQPGETMAAILRKRSDDPELKLLGVLTKSSVGRYKADLIR